jgi:eukaryotic-like serine/threonine-protein kinase
MERGGPSDRQYWQRVDEIFIAVIESSPPDRAARLDALCGSDAALRADVSRLLKSDGGVESGFLEAPAAVSAPASSAVEPRGIPIQERPGTIIGRYTLHEQIGEGGFGVVYLAEQEKPVRRRVALKIIKPGMDTRQVVARFQAERQALALMDHPNIASVLDGGETDSGRPYFVMELVKGIPITEYCDQCSLTTRDRLALFVLVCQAVQHAHQKGIIHRDLKPSNVMIAMQDGSPAPKVIDFGVAKAINQRLTEHTLHTQFAQLVGTPLYMSPEQAEMSPLEVDTRSDIYSLGALLYELLTGTTPFERERLTCASFDELRRIIRKEDPPTPSGRISTLGERASAIAERRRTDARRLQQLVRGDLDWIVMKALEKDRTRRYESASGFAADVGRYLDDLPVEATPPSVAYRWRKFVRRHRVGASLAAAFVGLVTASSVISTVLWRRAAAAETQQSRERERAEDARDEAEAVTEFLTDTLAAVDPGKQGKDVTVREVLDHAAERLSEKFSEKPLIEARLRHDIGWTFLKLGLSDKAQAHLSAAAALYHREKGESDPQTLRANYSLAVVSEERGDYTAAEAQQRATLETQRRVLGEEHADTLNSMNHLAVLYAQQGHYEQAEPLFVKILEIRKRVLGEEHPDTLVSMNSLAVLYVRRGMYQQAEPLYVQCLGLRRRVLGEEHPFTLASMSNLASHYYDQGRYAEAEPLNVQALEIRRRVLGAEHPNTLRTMSNLGGLYKALGRYDKAEPLFAQVLSIRGRVLGEEHPDTLDSMNNLASLYSDQARYDQAEPLMIKAMEIQKRVLGAEHPDTLVYMSNLAVLYQQQGRFELAEPLFVQALEIRKRVLGAEHPFTLSSMNHLSELYLDQGRYEEAVPLSLGTVTSAAKILPPEHPDLASYRGIFGRVLLKLGRLDEAEGHLLANADVLSAAGSHQHEAGEVVKALVKLYEARHSTEPDKGYDVKAAQWSAKLETTSAHSTPSPNGSGN